MILINKVNIANTPTRKDKTGISSVCVDHLTLTTSGRSSSVSPKRTESRLVRQDNPPNLNNTLRDTNISFGGYFDLGEFGKGHSSTSSGFDYSSLITASLI